MHEQYKLTTGICKRVVRTGSRVLARADSASNHEHKPGRFFALGQQRLIAQQFDLVGLVKLAEGQALTLKQDQR